MYPNIEAERVRYGMSKEEFAKNLGVSLKTYYNWLNGLTAIPSTALKKMSLMFHVDIGYLLEEKTDTDYLLGLSDIRRRG